MPGAALVSGSNVDARAARRYARQLRNRLADATARARMLNTIGALVTGRRYDTREGRRSCSSKHEAHGNAATAADRSASVTCV
jgi:hypothetical protein